MLISLNWIKEFTQLPDLSPQELSEKFTMATCEVEDVIIEGECFKKIIVAQVIAKEPHPDADKLNLVTFKISETENRRVVCGASNVTIGMKTPFAPIGVTLPIGFTLEPKKIRGILSEGMLCSKSELGLEENSAGIWELPNDTKVGITMNEYLGMNEDIILDIDNKSITHRPDLWGHYGMAREFSTIFENDLAKCFNQDWINKIEAYFSKDQSPIIPNVEKDSACLGYFGLSVDNIKVKDSPDWLKNRLVAVGLRPINNIVDISNYVMIELGMPLHIFDRDLIEDNIIHIKKCGSDQTFKTLDEIDRSLISSDSVISDSKKPLVLGGIMGGLNSGVNERTSKIFIEVANWKASAIRQTSTRLGLRTDSSSRYEKTLDSKLMYRTLLRTLELVLDFNEDAIVVGKPEYDGPNLSDIKDLVLETSRDKICSILGKELTEKQIIKIFTALDFKVTPKNNKLSVVVPSYRATKDIEFEADLVEEIGRIIGYDNIVPLSPDLGVKPVKLQPHQRLHRKIRDFMIYQGSSFEVITYPLIGNKLLKKVSWPKETSLKLVNALSVDAEMMRPSLIPSTLEAIAKNSKSFSSFKFFEIGRSYIEDQKDFSVDHSQFICCSYSKDHSVFMEVLNQMESLCVSLNLPFEFVKTHPKFKNPYLPEEWEGIHPFEFYNIKVMGRLMGGVFTLHPILSRSLKIKGNTTIGLIDLSAFETRELKAKVNYKSLPKFPSSTFDWTVILDNDKEVFEIFTALKKIKIKELESVKIVDVYKMSDNEKTVTLRATFIDPDKTLKGPFLETSKETLISTLDKAGFPLKME